MARLQWKGTWYIGRKGYTQLLAWWFMTSSEFRIAKQFRKDWLEEFRSVSSSAGSV